MPGIVENNGTTIGKLAITPKAFGDILFNGIRDDKVFMTQSHPKLIRILTSDKLIGIVQPNKHKNG